MPSGIMTPPTYNGGSDYEGGSWSNPWGGNGLGGGASYNPELYNPQDAPPWYSNPGGGGGGGSNRPGWRATDDEGGGYWEDGRSDSRLSSGFNGGTFNPFNPGDPTSAPWMQGMFPTLDMMRYLSGTALEDRSQRYQQSMNAARFAMDASAQPINAFDWWRLVRGPNRQGAGGTPLPAFLGQGGQKIAGAEDFQFPQVAYAGETFTAPSGQQFGNLSPSEQQGLIGFYRSLGVPVEDLVNAISRPAQGLMGSGSAVRRPMGF